MTCSVGGCEKRDRFDVRRPWGEVVRMCPDCTAYLVEHEEGYRLVEREGSGQYRRDVDVEEGP